MLLTIKKTYRLLRIILHVLWGVVQVLYYLNDKNTTGDKEQLIIQRWFERFVRLLNIEKRVHGEIYSNKQLMVANHVSWKDIVLLNSVYPARFVAMSEIATWPVVGWLATKVGTLFVKRGSISELRQLNAKISEALKKGIRVTLFPEGGTSDGHDIAHLYPGLFQSVINASDDKASLGVQPIVIIYKVDGELSPHIPFTGEVNMLANLWAVLGFDHITADIYFTPYICARNMTRKTLSQRSLQQMQKILKNKK